MPTGNDSRRLFTTGFARHLYIKFLRNVFLQRNTDTLFINQFLSLFYSFRSTVFQHLELIIGLPDQRTQSHSDGQPDHSRTGDSYSHCIFQDISTQQYLYFLRFGPQSLCSFCYTQCNCNRLCTSDSRNHLPLY